MRSKQSNNKGKRSVFERAKLIYCRYRQSFDFVFLSATRSERHARYWRNCYGPLCFGRPHAELGEASWEYRGITASLMLPKRGLTHTRLTSPPFQPMEGLWPKTYMGQCLDKRSCHFSFTRTSFRVSRRSFTWVTGESLTLCSRKISFRFFRFFVLLLVVRSFAPRKQKTTKHRARDIFVLYETFVSYPKVRGPIFIYMRARAVSRNVIRDSLFSGRPVIDVEYRWLLVAFDSHVNYTHKSSEDWRTHSSFQPKKKFSLGVFSGLGRCLMKSLFLWPKNCTGKKKAKARRSRGEEGRELA